MASVQGNNIQTTRTLPEFCQEEVNKLMSDGKRLLATKDIQGACDIFADVCAKLAEKFGQTANECGDAYLYYGKTLLDLARSESEVLGSSIPKGDIAVTNIKEKEADNVEINTQPSNSNGKENGCTEDDRPTSSGNSKCSVENAATEKPCARSKDESGDGDTENDDIEDADIDEEGVDDGSAREGDEGEDSEGDEEDENEESENENGSSDDVSTMQQAWEILELCRIVFARSDSKEYKLKQAEANLLLGEIGMESEHYPEAIGDFMECLRIQERFLESNDRRLAETFYNLGLAYSFDRHYGKAIEYYSKAIAIIKSRIEYLISVEDSENITELKELQELLPDLLAKVDDAEYMKKTTEEIVKSAASIAKGSIEDEEKSSDFDKPMDSVREEKVPSKITDIGYLVRKKRKTDDCDEVATKRSKEAEKEPNHKN